MSTIKVNTIQHSSGANAAITLSSNSDVVFTGNVTVSNKTITLEGPSGVSGGASNTNDVLIANGSVVVRDTIRLKSASAPTNNAWTQIANYGDGNFVIARYNTNGTYLSNLMVGYNNGDIVFSSTTGQADRMTIDRNGYVIRPYQPCFYAYQSSATSTRNLGPLTFDSTRMNVGGFYNVSNGRFTAPIAGNYMFFGHGLHRSQSASQSIELTFYKNGSNINSRGMAYATGYGGGEHIPMQTTVIIALAAGDYVQFGISSTATTSDLYYGENLAHFAGYLL